MPRKSIAGVARKAQSESKKFLDARAQAYDGFTNFIARLGFGANNQNSASHYRFDYLTRNRTELEAAYRTAWMVGAAIDYPAEDMTREGVDFKGEIDPKNIQTLQAKITELKIWHSICEAIKWSRLFGGAICVMLIDGQDVSKPLRPETVGRNQFKGLLVLDRWLVQPQLTNLITDLGPEIGLPKYYDVVADSRALAAMHIHHSRVLRFEGLDLPYYQKLVEMMWGQSVIERIKDRLVAFDSATVGAAQLVYKAHLRTIKIEGLRDIIGTGGPAYEALFKFMETIRVTQSNEGLTLLDKNDDFEVNQYTFSGLSDIILQFGQQLSGALQIPLVRLFGQSPAGMNSTGESDLRTYYDNINKTQETMLRPILNRLLEVMHRSVIGDELPEDFNYKFRPLWQLKEEEKADIANKDADTQTKLLDAGLISPATALKELRQAGEVSNRFSNITDKDIADADQEPPKGEGVGSDEPDGNDGDEHETD